MTLWYRAPEILLAKEIYACPVDCWSLGAIIGEMLTNVPVFQGDSEIDQLFKIFRVLGTPNESIWPGVTDLQGKTAPYISENNFLSEFSLNFPMFPKGEIPNPNRFEIRPKALDLVMKLLTYDPRKRISTTESLRHSYFDKYDSI